MVRDNTVVGHTEQGHLPRGRATITLRLRRVARRRARLKQSVWPISGQRLDNTNSVNGNINQCRFASNRLRMVLRPVNGYQYGYARRGCVTALSGIRAAEFNPERQQRVGITFWQ